MTTDEIQSMIAKFEALETALQELSDDYDAKRSAVIPADVQTVLDDLDAEYKPKLAGARSALDMLESDIKAMVVLAGKTVESDNHVFRYSDGKITWDGGLLEGIATIIPQVNAARKKGNPYITHTKKGGKR